MSPRDGAEVCDCRVRAVFSCTGSQPVNQTLTAQHLKIFWNLFNSNKKLKLLVSIITHIFEDLLQVCPKMTFTDLQRYDVNVAAEAESN